MHQQQQQQNSVSVPAADAPAVEVKHSSSVIASLAESAHSICLGYFGPTVFAVGITLLRFPYTTIPVADVSIGAVAIVFSIFNCGITYYACYREWTPAEMKQGIKGRIRRLSYQWSSFYEGARDLKTWYVRQHVFEDMLVAYVIAGLSAVYPQSIAGCTAMCGLMFLVSVAHLVYLLMVKPYESKLEGFLSVINAIIMVVIALLSTVTLINDTNTIETVLGVALLAANAFYFVQALILCGVAFIEMIRDKSKSKEEENKGLEGPLLMMVEPESQTTAHQAPSNPQAQPDYQAVPAQQQQSQPVVNPLAQGHY